MICDFAFLGKQYNRGVRVLKTIYELLQRIKLEVFQDWLAQKGKFNDYVNFMESYELHNFCSQRKNENFETCMETFETTFDYFSEFEREIYDKFGPMAIFWQSFIEMVQILLDFIKSIIIGDWSLHLNSTARMLPWFHAYDRTNYARHFSYYWATQCQLNEKHPAIYQAFAQGDFCTKRTIGNFNLLPPNQVIEQTINKEQKGPGGIIGISTSIGSVQRWVLSSHTFATLISDFKHSIDLENPNAKPKDISEKRRVYDEKCVQACCETIKQWCDPFQGSDNIVNLSSGVSDDKETESDLLNAKYQGDLCLTSFLNERIFNHGIPLNDPLKKNNLKTFATKKSTVKLANVEVAIKADRETFGRLIAIQQTRKIDL